MEHIYAAIDLKSFYASVECVERHLDPLTTNLVVADPTRTEKTICLAVSPSLKACGVGGRPRLFEVIERVKTVNAERMAKAIQTGGLRRQPDGSYQFTASSYDAPALAKDPSLKLSYIVAPPRMQLYENYSTAIYGIYLKYIAPEDMHVYSIDEVFFDLTRYLHAYHMTAHELTMTMIREVLYTTGITATAGIGTNLYLAKIAMDIVAKKMPADKDGVRIAALSEQRYRELLWCHQPLTDFWRIGRGYSAKLTSMGLYTMGDIARASLSPTLEKQLYKAFGVNAELLIDHAWGWEPVTIDQIKSYRPESHSLSSGQVLKEPYPYKKAKLIVREMTELLCHDLVRKHLVTQKITLTINYDRSSLVAVIPGKALQDTVYVVAKTHQIYHGKVTTDLYGRPHPYHAHGTATLERYTNAVSRIAAAMMTLYERITDKDLFVRRVNIAVCGLISETDIPKDQPEQLSFYTDYQSLEQKREEERQSEEKERHMLRTMLALQDKYGRNAVLRGMNLLEGGTTIERNGQIGGHKA